MQISETIRKEITKLEAEYKELDNEWDRLDSMGNQSEAQRKIANKMEVIRKKIDGRLGLID